MEPRNNLPSDLNQNTIPAKKVDEPFTLLPGHFEVIEPFYASGISTPLTSHSPAQLKNEETGSPVFDQYELVLPSDKKTQPSTLVIAPEKNRVDFFPDYLPTSFVTRSEKNLQALTEINTKEKTLLDKTEQDIHDLENELLKKEEQDSKEEAAQLKLQIDELKVQQQTQEIQLQLEKQEKLKETAFLLQQIETLERTAAEEKQKKHQEFQKELLEAKKEQQRQKERQQQKYEELQKQRLSIEFYKAELKNTEEKMQALRDKQHEKENQLHSLNEAMSDLQKRKAQQEKLVSETEISLALLSPELESEKAKMLSLETKIRSLQGKIQKDRQQQQEIEKITAEMQETQKQLAELNANRRRQESISIVGRISISQTSTVDDYIILPPRLSLVPAMILGLFSLGVLGAGIFLLKAAIFTAAAVSGPLGWTLIALGALGATFSTYRIKRNYDTNQRTLKEALLVDDKPESEPSLTITLDAQTKEQVRLQNYQLLLQERINNLTSLTQVDLVEEKENMGDVFLDLSAATEERDRIKSAFEKMILKESALKVEKDKLAQEGVKLENERLSLEDKMKTLKLELNLLPQEQSAYEKQKTYFSAEYKIVAFGKEEFAPVLSVAMPETPPLAPPPPTRDYLPDKTAQKISTQQPSSSSSAFQTNIPAIDCLETELNTAVLDKAQRNLEAIQAVINKPSIPRDSTQVMLSTFLKQRLSNYKNSLASDDSAVPEKLPEKNAGSTEENKDKNVFKLQTTPMSKSNAPKRLAIRDSLLKPPVNASANSSSSRMFSSSVAVDPKGGENKAKEGKAASHQPRIDALKLRFS